MARPKEFDRSEVLERAMDAFWRQGYETTSVQDLVDAMGIGRASLYGTFGSKEAIFGEAMDLYMARAEEKLFGLLRGEGNVRHVLRDFFRALLEHQSNRERRSCLIAKTAALSCNGNEVVADRAGASLRHIENAFHDLFKRARSSGQIPSSKSPRALARFMTSSMMGVSVFASVLPEPRAVQDVVRVALSALD